MRWIVRLMPVWIILGTGALFLLTGLPIGKKSPPGGAPPRDEGGRVLVREDQDYYLLVPVIELFPVNRKGNKWDVFDGSAPDIYYEVEWKGTRIHKSSTKEDDLIARWMPIGVNVMDAIKSGKIQIDSVVGAPIVNLSAPEDEALIIHVFDGDVMARERAASIRIKLTELVEGDNRFVFEHSESCTVKRMIVRLVSLNKPLAEVVEDITRP